MSLKLLKVPRGDEIRDPAIGSVVCLADGTAAYIHSGCWRDPTYGRLSNWWTWSPVMLDGSLGEKVSGYGDFRKANAKLDVGVRVTLA